MLATGTRLGPYQILAPLGRGGMGEVYRARDLRLGREVAVKVVPERFVRDQALLERFEREAKAVAALAHPNVIVLYDIGREGGVPFAVTELLEGATLRERLAAGAMPWREALETAAAVADGLAAAHAKGITHRDIKPENLFLTADGRLKVLDFGLARFELPAHGGPETGLFVPGHTDPGMVMGTVGYMPPEQLRGQPADGRGDIFSLGCVLYELVSGARPFRGPTATAICAAILHEEPPALAALGVLVPDEVERVIRHCLAKDPGERFVSARDLAFALRGLLAGSGLARPAVPRPAPLSSLAVLPLANTNVDVEAEYLSDGLTEGLINRLSRLPGLRVMAPSTVFRYKGSDAGAVEIGRALHVRAVLTGQMFQRGQQLIVKVELVDVEDGSLLWGEQYHRELAAAGGVEEAVAGEVASRLRLALTGEQRRRLGQSRTDSPVAYHLYLKGRYHWNKRTEEGLRRSIKHFEEAIDLDPTYALAYAGVADAYVNLGGWSALPPRVAYPRAKAAAARALAIDDALAEAHASLAMVLKEYDWDWQAAGFAYERALALGPGYAVAHLWHGEYLAAIGRNAEAIAAMRRAIDLDPLSLIIHATLGRHGHHFTRQFDEAVAQLRRTLEMDEHFWVAHHWLAWTLAVMGRLEEAMREVEAARRLEDNLELLAVLGYTHGRAGQAAEARRCLGELEQQSASRYVSPMLPALITLGLGEHDEMFGWLEKAVADRAQMLSELGTEPAFDPVRGDPRFVALARRVGWAAGDDALAWPATSCTPGGL